MTNVVQQVGPAVVTVVGTVTYQTSPFGWTSSSDVSGSGVFISEEGYLITNYHVVEDASDLYIILSDGTEAVVSLVGYDIYADLAVLKSEGKVPAVAILGNSEVLDPGETVIAIGSPLAILRIQSQRVWLAQPAVPSTQVKVTKLKILSKLTRLSIKAILGDPWSIWQGK